MSVRINLEIGHEASVRTKRTPEGFTHDWEIFVRGYEGAEIHYYIEKVVFHLHETFQKPKRVIKEPPYAVKESGYAGFTLPIDIYLRNKDEPKKIKFNYDLHLQPTGPAIVNVQKEKYVFNSPNEEFKSRLLRGGGVIVNSLSAQENNENHTNRVSLEPKSELTSKPKLSGADPLRKIKIKEDSRAPDSFQSLFGPPITKTSKVFPDLKTVSKDVNKNTTTSSSSNNIKPEKDKEKSKEKTKYSPNKDRDKDRDKNKEKSDGDRRKEKDERRSKDKSKERGHSKEKSSKKEKSPKPRSPSPKRSPKRPPSPKRPTSPSATKHKERDEKKLESASKEKDRKEKSDEKSDKKSKKDKRDKEKEHKESKHKEKESQKPSDYKDHKNKDQKPIVKETVKDKEPSPLPPPKIERKEKPKEPVKEEPKVVKDLEPQVSSIAEKPEKLKSDKNEEKQKHKHKKKDKDRKDKDKDKTHRDKSKDKEKSVITKPPEPPKDVKEEKTNSLFSSPKSEEKQKKPISLFSEGEAESSNSSISSKEDTFTESTEKVEPKKESIFEPKKPKLETEKVKKDKTKKNKEKKLEKEEKKRKRRNEKADDEPLEKVPKEENSVKDSTSDSEPSSNTSRSIEVDKENQENPEDYMQILRDLQTKIMNLQDNAELQKVVQLIAETGRYEVSQRTFDFDLCLLDKSTVRQLQEFFASST